MLPLLCAAQRECPLAEKHDVCYNTAKQKQTVEDITMQHAPARELLHFIKNSPTCYHVTENIRQKLLAPTRRRSV